jgi:hypothetical protein
MIWGKLQRTAGDPANTLTKNLQNMSSAFCLTSILTNMELT